MRYRDLKLGKVGVSLDINQVTQLRIKCKGDTGISNPEDIEVNPGTNREHGHD